MQVPPYSVVIPCLECEKEFLFHMYHKAFYNVRSVTPCFQTEIECLFDTVRKIYHLLASSRNAACIMQIDRKEKDSFQFIS